MITERSAVMLISTNLISIKAVIDMFWKLTNQDFNICLVDVYNMKIMAYLHAFPSLPPSSPSHPRLAFLPAQNPLSLTSNACHAVVRYLTTALTRPISKQGVHGHKLIYRFSEPNADWILKNYWKALLAFFFFLIYKTSHTFSVFTISQTISFTRTWILFFKCFLVNLIDLQINCRLPKYKNMHAQHHYPYYPDLISADI